MSETTLVSGVLPDHWQKLGGSMEYVPLPLELSRFYIWGPPKSGKSTFAASFPNAVHIDIEGGAHSIVHRRARWYYAPVLHDGELTEVHRKLGGVSLTSLMDALTRGSPFTTVIVDTFDALLDLALKEMERTSGKTTKEAGWGTGGWTDVNNLALSWVRRLTGAGYGLVTLAHQKIETETIGQKEISFLRPASSPGTYGPLFRDADYIMRIGRDDKGKWDPALKRVRTTYKLEVANTDNLRPDCSQGVRVSLTESLEIPQVDGYNVLRRAYDAAVAASRKL